MSTVTPMPKFAGASALSLTHLQRMADAITHLRDGVHSSPGAQSRAAAVPGMAYYIPPEVNFTAEEQTYTEDWNEPGLVQGVMCVGRQHAPTIVEGVIRMPFAQTTWAEDVSGSTPGVVYDAEFAAVESPSIEQGVVTIPYANTEGCEGVATPGVLRDVRIDPTAVAPSIESGVLILPASTAELADSPSEVVGIVSDVKHVDAGTGWRVRNGVIQVPRAQVDDCLGLAGVISGIQYGYGSSPMICDGVISLPFAPRGLMGDCGGLVTWDALRAAGGLVRITSGDATHLGYSAQLTAAGGLALYIDRA